ncbi:MAG: dihydroorotate dehydrogenase B catalytic subunit [Candidatus Cloacimonadota bacterium]|nr:MAG: dihydroorotate dehydrogenase B catalytic subunit [Candidatus Cloacimonadota bacterium]
MNRLATSLGKLKLKNPVTVASGTFGIEAGEYYDLNKLGAIVTKTITKEPKAGNKPPRIFETTSGMLNSIGLQNPGIDGFIKNTLPLYKDCSSPMLVSFSGSTINEFCEIMSLLDEQEQIAGYEINVSCPNVENEGIAFGTDPKTVFNLTRELKKITEKEVCVKLTPNVTDIALIAKAAEEGGADSLALINTLLGMAIDYQTGKSRIKRGVAGFSGPAIKPIALLNVWKVASATDIPILAMGGICDWKDALEFFYAGASAVAIGTQNFVNPTATIETINGLDKYLAEKDKTLTDIIGKVNGIG